MPSTENNLIKITKYLFDISLKVQFLIFIYSFLKPYFLSHFLTFSKIFKVQIYFRTLLLKRF